MTLRAADLDRQVRFERKVDDEAFDGAGSAAWELFGELWADVRDILPSRAKGLDEGITLALRPVRIRIRSGPAIESDMRVLVDDRVLQIVAGPALSNDRRFLELVAEEYSTAGNPA